MSHSKLREREREYKLVPQQVKRKRERASINLSQTKLRERGREYKLVPQQVKRERERV